MTLTYTLRLFGLALLILGLVYQTGGWRAYWRGLHRNISDPPPLNPLRPTWSNTAATVGFLLVLLSFALEYAGYLAEYR
jgi:cytochrome b561